jgi:hypothetical protein
MRNCESSDNGSEMGSRLGKSREE